MMRFQLWLLTEMVADTALKYAEMAHSGQIRKFSGKPYVTHPTRVSQIIHNFKKSQNLDQLMAAALLHDTIEDTDTDYEVLRKMFGELIANLVQELTSDKDEIRKLGKTEYLKQKMLKMSNYGLTLKLADRLDNVSDLVSGNPQWALRYATETKAILDALDKGRTLTNTQRKLVLAIKRTLNAFYDHHYKNS